MQIIFLYTLYAKLRKIKGYIRSTVGGWASGVCLQQLKTT